MPTSLYEAARPNPAGYRDATVEDLARLGCEVRIVDVREPHEYNGELGHIAGSELVPLATVEAASESWDRSAEILIVCRSGARSGRAATALAQRGFTAVMNLAGGMLAYVAARNVSVSP
jgi:rhodanese-related sulfurtransferase